VTAAAVTEVDGGAVIDADRVRGRLRGFLVGGCGAGGLSVGRVGPAGQAFDVQRGAGEQQLDVEQAGAATARPVQAVLVLELGDSTFGIGQPAYVRPHAAGSLAALPGGVGRVLGVGLGQCRRRPASCVAAARTR